MVKWKDHGEDRNTWEPWGNLLTADVQEDARKVKDAALPTVAKKLTVPLLRHALQSGVIRLPGQSTSSTGRS